MKDLMYLTWLSILPGLSADRKLELMRTFGSARGVFEAPADTLKEMFAKNGILSSNASALKRLLRKDAEGAQRCLQQAKKTGAAVIPMDSGAYPSSLQTIKDPPLVLFALGDVSLLQTRCIAVVGTRRASPYGRWAAAEIARKVSLAGVTVVSGMAEGIDTAAHEGCLQADGKTIAVFGTGVDICFPKSNARLYEEIRQKGLLLSEYPFGERGYAMNFPERNRIISGLSESCIVAEGAVKSGSLITAGLAAEQGRGVFALPGNVNQPGSAGTNLLISEGVPPIYSLDHLLHILGLEGLPAEQRTDLSEHEKALMRHILNCGSSSKQYICETCSIGAQEASMLLTCLELKGLVRLEGSQVFVL
ncbi:MAG: DNA-processing protein DprA [Firmicutes bacterium]|nr:DNA-processing protein DprA [Bacillota bacterium]